MVNVRCWVCEGVRELSALDDVDPLCSPECLEEFQDVVGHLVGGGTLGDMDISPDGELGRRSVAEVKRLRRAEMIERRSWREHDYEQSRPRPMRALYPV